jgi:hypothetical protein
MLAVQGKRCLLRCRIGAHKLHLKQCCTANQIAWASVLLPLTKERAILACNSRTRVSEFA